MSPVTRNFCPSYLRKRSLPTSGVTKDPLQTKVQKRARSFSTGNRGTTEVSYPQRFQVKAPYKKNSPKERRNSFSDSSQDESTIVIPTFAKESGKKLCLNRLASNTDSLSNNLSEVDLKVIVKNCVNEAVKKLQEDNQAEVNLLKEKNKILEEKNKLIEEKYKILNEKVESLESKAITKEEMVKKEERTLEQKYKRVFKRAVLVLLIFGGIAAVFFPEILILVTLAVFIRLCIEEMFITAVKQICNYLKLKYRSWNTSRSSTAPVGN